MPQRTNLHSPSLFLGAILTALVLAGSAGGTETGQPASTGFEILDHWRDSVLAGDDDTLKATYSQNPPATVASPSLKSSNPKDEIKFWLSLKKSGLLSMDIKPVSNGFTPAGAFQIAFQGEFMVQGKSGPEKFYASVSHDWVKQGDTWRIVKTQRTDLSRLKLPVTTNTVIYPSADKAEEDLQAALKGAAAAGKRVLVVFGANWCYECHVLDAAFHMPEIVAVLEPNYEVVHVDTGRGELNRSLIRRCNVVVEQGIPVLAVLDGVGRVLFSQRDGRFAERLASLAPGDIIDFLNQWKPEDAK